MKARLGQAFLDGEHAAYHVVNEYSSIGGVAAYNENALAIMVSSLRGTTVATELLERLG